jgi:hypothetical protein
MEKLQRLLDLFAAPTYEAGFVMAKASGTCIMCGGPARSFRDPWARLEYDLSALCQSCQDEYFTGG